jgi:2-phosphosulfolactate phosphatase
MTDSASGRELVDRGFSDDVAIAARLDVTDLVPVLADGMFQGQ